MKEVITKNIFDDDLLDDNIDYIVNVINDKTLRNQIQIEILAKNLKKKQKDVRLRIESELVTTIIEENVKLNRVKRTTIHTKLLPKVSSVQTEDVQTEKTLKAKKQKVDDLTRNNESNGASGEYVRTPSSDSGLGDSRPELNKIKLAEIKTIKRTHSEECLKIENISKKSKTPKTINERLKHFENKKEVHHKKSPPEKIKKDLQDNNATGQNNKSTTSSVKDRIKRIESQIKQVKKLPSTKVVTNELKKGEEEEEPIIKKEVELETEVNTTIRNNGNNMLKVLNHLLRDKYMKEFNLKNSELDMIFSFYNMNKKGTNLDTARLERFLYLSSCKREELIADKSDIKQALVTVDSDNDSKITLDEFIHLLVLFFADRSNFRQRLESILHNLSIFHRKIGWLTEREAGDFSDFIFKFYGKFNGRQEYLDGLDYKTFCMKLAPSIEPHLFVKW